MIAIIIPVWLELLVDAVDVDVALGAPTSAAVGDSYAAAPVVINGRAVIRSATLVAHMEFIRFAAVFSRRASSSSVVLGAVRGVDQPRIHFELVLGLVVEVEEVIGLLLMQFDSAMGVNCVLIHN